jgi:hypothetical protein
MSRRRAVLLAALFTLGLGACGPAIFFFGDSQLYATSAPMKRAYNSDYTLTIDPEGGCGVLPPRNPACTGGDWPALIASTMQKHGRPAAVEVQLGINDVYGYSVAELDARAPDAIRAFLALIPADLHVVWANVPETLRAFIPQTNAFNDALDRVDQESEQLDVVDIQTLFAPHWPEWFGPDQLHFNAIGSDVYTEAMCRALDKYALVSPSAACNPAPTTTTTTEPEPTTTTTTEPETTTTTTTEPETTTTTTEPEPTTTTTTEPETTTTTAEPETP